MILEVNIVGTIKWKDYSRLLGSSIVPLCVFTHFNTRMLSHSKEARKWQCATHPPPRYQEVNTVTYNPLLLIQEWHSGRSLSCPQTPAGIIRKPAMENPAQLAPWTGGKKPPPLWGNGPENQWKSPWTGTWKGWRSARRAWGVQTAFGGGLGAHPRKCLPSKCHPGRQKEPQTT